MVLMPLPAYATELNSVENIWDYLRSNFLSHCVWDTYEAILDACCDAWTPSWPNPSSSPQSELKIGHSSKLRPVGINQFKIRECFSLSIDQDLKRLRKLCPNRI
jgi:hypothetical protein